MNPSVSAIGVQAPKGLFFVPGKKNLFADLVYEHVIFDSGCCNHLLPFPKTKTIDEFWTKFRDYSWSVAHTGGEGALNSPVLIIRSF